MTLTSLVASLLLSLMPYSAPGMASSPASTMASAVGLSPTLTIAQSPVPATEIITIENSIVIHRKPQRVFDFVADFLNDPYWREEVNTMTSDGPLEVGTIYLEDSHLGFQSSFITETEIVTLDSPSLVVAETTSSNPYYLRTTRKVQPWGWFSSRITYTLEFERDLVTATVGFPLPDPLVEFYYNLRMREYLLRLKLFLETGITFLSPGN